MVRSDRMIEGHQLISISHNSKQSYSYFVLGISELYGLKILAIVIVLKLLSHMTELFK